MLDLVHCKVLSIIESDQVDAYLLSESSMFVYPHKLVLKTCGTTTLLCGLASILEIAAINAGFPHTPAHAENQVSAAAPPYRVFYSRKNYLYPDQQRGPHRSWRDEVRALDRLFQHGSAYMIGKMNGEHWYLYITEPETRLTPPATPEHEKVDGQETQTRLVELPNQMAALTADGEAADVTQDETLEILMTDLDVENAKQFYHENAILLAPGKDIKSAQRKMAQALGSIEEEGSDDSTYDVFEQTSSDHGGDNLPSSSSEEDTTEGHALGTLVSDTCGLSDVYPTSKYPDARIDAYLFTPCGFSANGVIPAPASFNTTTGDDTSPPASPTTHYFTVHVTPEPECSYASFETNVPARQTGRETADVVKQVVDIFQPGRFSVTLFEAKNDDDAGVEGGEVVAALALALKKRDAQKKASAMDQIRGYRRVDRIVHDLDGYDLVFRYYERHDWKGGPPRLGEL